MARPRHMSKEPVWFRLPIEFEKKLLELAKAEGVSKHILARDIVIAALDEQ